MDYSITWTPESLAELERLAGFSALLDPEITDALKQIGDLIVTTAQRNAWTVFDDPTGDLADSIYFRMNSPKEMEVGVGVPYGGRREWGFSGQTDSLGRYYVNDPGKPYLIPALYEDEPMIETYITLAIGKALDRVAVGGAGFGSVGFNPLAGLLGLAALGIMETQQFAASQNQQGGQQYGSSQGG